MTNIFNTNFIIGNEIVFWCYLAAMLLIMILTIIFVRKELKKEKKDVNN